MTVATVTRPGRMNLCVCAGPEATLSGTAIPPTLQGGRAATGPRAANPPTLQGPRPGSGPPRDPSGPWRLFFYAAFGRAAISDGPWGRLVVA